MHARRPILSPQPSQAYVDLPGLSMLAACPTLSLSRTVRRSAACRACSCFSVVFVLMMVEFLVLVTFLQYVHTLSHNCFTSHRSVRWDGTARAWPEYHLIACVPLRCIISPPARHSGVSSQGRVEGSGAARCVFHRCWCGIQPACRRELRGERMVWVTRAGSIRASAC